MIGRKSAVKACVNDMKPRYVQRNIGRGDTQVGTTSAAVRSGAMRALATPKPLNRIMTAVKFQEVQKSRERGSFESVKLRKSSYALKFSVRRMRDRIVLSIVIIL
jgi:hypothetical protein